ncbi:MAG: class I SAM-dependent methyltransferase [Epsilonproteobacteria bacterium]|nr:class I SAM-dependent methyltransferase [Campylobacterota bacterium]
MDVKIYDKLAKKYDLATKIVSFGIEELWRWMFVREIKKHIKNGSLIDVASATGEMAKALDFDEMYLIEPSREMNLIASEKLKVKNEKCIEKKEENKIILECENKKIVIIEDTAEDFELDKEVDLITAFMAIRNFSDIEKGIKNLDRHLKNGGYFAIVEMVRSDSFFAKIIMWYMRNIVPKIAGLLVGMESEYKLLGESIDSLSEDEILKHFNGYKIIKKTKLIFPIATMIIMRKDGENT